MASIKKILDKNGEPAYIVQASNGRGRRVKRTWRPQEGWSGRTIERELNKFAAQLENELAGGGVKTRKEAVEERRKAEQEAAKLRTLRQYAQGVFIPAKSAAMSENGILSYIQFLDKHIIPVLGDYLMAEITPAMINGLILSFQGKGYSHSTSIKLYNILNGIFKMAFLDDSILQNPMLKVSRPKVRKEEVQAEGNSKAYTVEELRYILKCLKGENLKWQTYIQLVIDTGIRRGEACGLKWEDVDFECAYITVRRNLQYTKAAGVYTTTPKNGKSRIVDVGEDTLCLLRQLRQRQAQECISPYVFNQDGSPEPMHPQSPTHYFKKLERKYGIQDFHPHKLRHTSASLAILNGADVVSVSERLGHSDTAVTLRMYAHANDKSIRRAGQLVRDALKAEGE